MTFEKIELADCRATLYRGDCLELLAAGLLKADAIVMDPPYGIGFKHGGNYVGRVLLTATGNPSGGKLKPGTQASKTDTVVGDDMPFDPAPFMAYPRILMWGADRYRARIPDGGTILCWDKSIGYGPADSFVDSEYAWTNVKVRRTVRRQLWKGIASSGKDAPNQTQPRYHISQKPRELMRWCIQTLNIRPDSLIADPYMGSGSTGIAALSLGHRFIGVEIDPGHFATACARIERAWAKMGGAPVAQASSLPRRANQKDAGETPALQGRAP